MGRADAFLSLSAVDLDGTGEEAWCCSELLREEGKKTRKGQSESMQAGGRSAVV